MKHEACFVLELKEFLKQNYAQFIKKNPRLTVFKHQAKSISVLNTFVDTVASGFSKRLL